MPYNTTAPFSPHPSRSSVGSSTFAGGENTGFLPVDQREADLFGLWLEITYGDPMPVETPVAKRIQSKWRAMEGSDYCERLMFIIRATEAECPGLWSNIAYAGVNRLDAQDKHMMETTLEDLREADAMASETMRKARRRAALDKYHAYRRRLGQDSPSDNA